ncbi:Isochorismatase family [Emericellopsis cladophorae]|uniref:Isochorismatase family n=1 Tax=Emericellopsis cladophorae TaxID=2686198 RepID=A0A9P9XX60_9HYPO|nr:Isochorismatase family [Emericellopsis cladophorae]KAI6779487.1 Isochorismatase family [Emericellopsis cladophorae]
MFPFDSADLPQLTARKAFIGVDFQSDFTAKDGALAYPEPEGYVERAAKLATIFRQYAKTTGGDVVWVKSQFDGTRAVDEESIIVSDEPSPPPEPKARSAVPQALRASRRRLSPTLEDAVEAAGPPDDEAFLSQNEPKCLHTPAASDWAPEIKAAMDTTDMSLAKSHYSAFKDTRLLHLLRAKLVMEVVICGSMANVGVLATAMDAAGHGMAITVVEDCCGYRSEARQSQAIRDLIEFTGCEIASYEEMLETIDPKLARPKQVAKPMAATKEAARLSSSPDIVNPMTGLRLKSRSPLDAEGNAADASASTAPETESPKKLCEGDTDIIEKLLPKDLEAGIFDKVREEVEWQRMSHQGGEVPRLVAVQREVAEDGSIPVYRHPSDQSPPSLPFSPTVLAIKKATEKHLGHKLNHALIQYYRDGLDHISEHSDKTLDIVPGSYIANVSLGAERTMVFRSKRAEKDHTASSDSPKQGAPRQTQRAQLPHNSLCRMGLKTNMKWTHSIRQDKRAEREKTEAELAYSGRRISLTFRQIGTFLDKDETVIWGQGATGKTRAEAKPIANGRGAEAVDMIKAFGAENNSTTFDWSARYGSGFDVLHMSNSPRFFTSSDSHVNLRIALMLAELNITYAKGSVDPGSSESSRVDRAHAPPVKFVDVDEAKSTVSGGLAVMMYLDKTHSTMTPDKAFTRLEEALDLVTAVGRMSADAQMSSEIGSLLSPWDAYAAEGDFLAGKRPSLPDFVVWPVIHELHKEHSGSEFLKGLDHLEKYYKTVKEREQTKIALEKTAPPINDK